MNSYINILKKMNKIAANNGDVPVSCIIIKDNVIISKAYNMREKYKNPILHAEFIAIKKAAKKLNRWNLSDCTLISTLKPCNMCTEIIKESKIKNIYYILDKNKVVNNKIIVKKIECKEKEYFEKEIRSFFVNKR